MISKLKLAFVAAVALGALGLFLSPEEVEAFPGNNSSHWVCYHNGMPYTLVFVPPGGSPACPDLDPAFLAVWDAQDGYDCGGDGLASCTRERHIDCEYDSEPGDL